MLRTHLVFLSWFLIGCGSSGAGTCEIISGRPYPEKDTVRWEGTFNNTDSSAEVVLVVDGAECDRTAVPVGTEQAVKLLCSGLAAGDHKFELRRNQDTKPIATGWFMLATE